MQILTTRKEVFQWLRKRGCTVWAAWETAKHIGKPGFGTKAKVFQTY